MSLGRPAQCRRDPPATGVVPAGWPSDVIR